MQKHFKNSDKQVDKALVTINSSILITYFFVFQINSINHLVRWTILTSLSLFIVSLVLLIWHLVRFPLRIRILEQRRSKTVNKFSNRIASFLEQILGPLTEYKAKEELQKKIANAKTDEEKLELISFLKNNSGKGSLWYQNQPEEQTIRWVIESFIQHLGYISKDDYNIAFKKPLDERFGKLKLVIDLVAFKIRRHLFASGVIFALASIFMHLISK